MEVHRILGCGFLENVYQNALAIELGSQGISFRQQVAISVQYKGQPAGKYLADFVVDNQIIVELKSAKNLTAAHASQLINYLAASGTSVGLIFNFGAPSLQVKRRVWRHDESRQI
jgi:GxxExxY protein